MENYPWKDELLERDPCLEFADEHFDKAIAGYVERFGSFFTPFYEPGKMLKSKIKFVHPVLGEIIRYANHEEVREAIANTNPDLIFFDDLDDLDEAVYGTVSINRKPVVLYDREKCFELYTERDGMDYCEAQENFDFNVIGGWYGDYTPAFLSRDEEA